MNTNNQRTVRDVNESADIEYSLRTALKQLEGMSTTRFSKHQLRLFNSVKAELEFSAQKAKVLNERMGESVTEVLSSLPKE